MSKVKILSIAVIGLMLMNLGMLAFFIFTGPKHGMPGGRPGDREGPKQIIIERLHFNTEQVQQYEALIKTHQEDMRTLNEDMRDAKNTLYESLAGNQESRKDSLISRIGLLQKDIENLHYNHFLAIKNLCNPEQLKDFDRLTEELARFFAPINNNQPPPKD